MKSNHNGSANPDAKQYARVVLWNLCTLQASINTLGSKLIEQIGKAEGATDKQILIESKKYGEHVNKLAELLYRDALEQANIEQSPDFPHQK
jgi:hypothetical protein